MKSSRQSNLLRKLQKAYPLMQVFLFSPEGKSAKDWDPKTFTPKVGYALEEDFSKGKIGVYDQNGNFQYISSSPDDEPDEYMIIVMINERTVFSPKELGSERKNINLCPIEYMAEIDEGYIYEAPDYYSFLDCGDNPSPPPFPPSPEPDPVPMSHCSNADRDSNNDPDHLSRFRLESFDRLDYIKQGFWDTNFEFRVVVVFASSNNSVATTRETIWATGDDLVDRYTFRRNSVNWINANRRVITWDEDAQGINMNYQWFEIDGGGDPIEITGSIENEVENSDGTTTTVELGYTIPTDDNDDDIGWDTVEYCDDTDGEGEEYNTGFIVFHVNQQ